jgi:hypothetical protein
MNSIINPARRIGATLVIAGMAAFGSVAVAPAAFADESSAGQYQEGQNAPAVPALPDTGKPVKTPKMCTDKDLEKYAKDQAKWNQQATLLSTLAAKSRQAADILRAQKNLKPAQLKLATALADGLVKAAESLEAQASELLDKTVFGLDCTVPGGPRF